MAKNVQNVTLSLTLPLSCQICLGKVSKPMICSNLHVFCAACIKLWLQKCSHCPTCRVPITLENPCREIIGTTRESESTESPIVNRCLRKTQWELLLQEYEDEMGALLKDTEELKIRNECLESQLNASRKPAASPVPPSKTPPDSALLEETGNKLQAATELCQTLEEDVSNLKDVNKILRSQNIHLVQENLHLSAEVQRRSPKKFGRFTAAALESKISQYEREMTQLKKALKRNDAYIEELETRLAKLQRCLPSPSSSSEQTADCGSSKPDVTSADPSDSQVSHADEASGSQKDTVVNFPMPSTPLTPSSVLDRLSLKSPVMRCKKKAGCKRLPYLRRLYFEECRSSSSFPAESRINLFDLKPIVNSANKPSVWKEPCTSTQPVVASTQHSTQESQQNFSTGESLAEEIEINRAYLKIVSELYSMLAKRSSSRANVPQVPPDFHAEAVDPESAGEQQPHGATDSPESSGESVKRKCPTSLASSSPTKLSRKK